MQARQSEYGKIAVPETDSEGITLADVVRFFHRHWLWMVVPAMVAGILAGSVFRWVLPEVWEATANLVIMPPKFSSKLDPSVMSVQAYQKILESNSVLAEARKRLIAKGVLGEKEPFRLNEIIKTEIFVSRKEESVSLAPMILVTGTYNNAAGATDIANTVISVFLETTKALSKDATSPSSNFVDKEFREAGAALKKEETKLVQINNDFQTRLLRLSDNWEKRILNYNISSQHLLGSHLGETARILETYKGEVELDWNKKYLETMHDTLKKIEEELAKVAPDLDAKRRELTVYEKSIQTTPRFLTLNKAITDNALWQEMTGGQGGEPDWKTLQGKTLTTQEINPQYTILEAKISGLLSAINVLEPKTVELHRDRIKHRAELLELDKKVRTNISAITQIEENRKAEYRVLVETRKIGASDLLRHKTFEVETLKLQMGAAVAEQERAVAKLKAFDAFLAPVHSQAQIAGNQSDLQNIRLASPAAALNPNKRRSLLIGLLAAISVGLMAVLFAVFREVNTRVEA